MYIARYCKSCDKTVTLTERNYYTAYNPETQQRENYFICPVCKKHRIDTENRLPDSLSKDEIEEVFKNFEIIKDRAEYNESTLYPVYYQVYKQSEYIASYGTGNEEDFFYVRR